MLLYNNNHGWYTVKPILTASRVTVKYHDWGVQVSITSWRWHAWRSRRMEQREAAGSGRGSHERVRDQTDGSNTGPLKCDIWAGFLQSEDVKLHITCVQTISWLILSDHWTVLCSVQECSIRKHCESDAPFSHRTQCSLITLCCVFFSLAGRVRVYSQPCLSVLCLACVWDVMHVQLWTGVCFNIIMSCSTCAFTLGQTLRVNTAL